MMKHTLERVGTVPVIGGNIHCRRYEPHDQANMAKTPIIFIHGGPGASHSIIYDALANMADDRTAIFYDQLGSYYSPANMTPELMKIERFSDEVSCVMKWAGTDKAILLGHSWGGAVAAHFAIHQPEAVEALILSCPLLSSRRWIDDCSRLLAELAGNAAEVVNACEARGDTDSQVYREIDRLFSAKHFIRSDAGKYILAKHRHKMSHKVYSDMWGASEFSCSGTLKDLDLFPHLSEIVASTLLICGEYDTATPATMKAAQALIKGSSVGVVAGGGHLAFLDNNIDYMNCVTSFLSKCGV